MNEQAQAVFDFWFQPGPGQPSGAPRREWFQKDDAFDREIGRRFGALIDQALAGGLLEWDAEGPQSQLARILLLDQFTRNVHRGTPQAFAGDALALQAAQAMVDTGQDGALPPLQRGFVYLPFEHAEDMAMQERQLALFQATERPADDRWAEHHHAIIARFGRFPHRNRALGRETTPEEQQFLDEDGFAG